MTSLGNPFLSSTTRDIPVKCRTDLSVERQNYLGKTYWILKDPIGSRYFRLQEEEYALLQLFDGKHSLDSIKKIFEKEFPPQKITFDELHNLLGQFHQSGLVVASAPNQGEELLKRGKKRKKKEMKQKLTNVLAIKFKGIDPDAMFTKLYRYVRWCFHPVTLFCALALGISAVMLIMVQFDTFRSKLPEFYTFFSPVNMFCLGLVLVCTKILHEFGHGLTCKHFKGECHEMGIMILVLTPCLYVNVSDSWLLPNKWHRIAIGAAGVCVECTLAAFCTFIWWFSEPGLLHYIAINIMFISSVSTILFNINPLLRFDGYYILADYLEIPNMRQKAMKILTQKCSHWFLGIEPPEDPFLPQKNQLWFALYSIGAFLYRWVIMASILYFLYTLFKYYELRIIGQAIAAMSLFSLFVMPIIKMVKFFWVPGRIYKVKKPRFYMTLALIVGIIAFVLFYPLPYSVIAPVIIELRATTSQQVFVPKLEWGSQLRKVHVVPGQMVAAGSILAELENPDLHLDLLDAEGNYNQMVQELETLQVLENYNITKALSIKTQKEAVVKAWERYESRKRDFNMLVLRAPMAGMVVSPPWKIDQPMPDDQLPQWSGTPLDKKNINATLESGTVVCSVGDPKFLEAVVVVDQSKIPFLALDQQVELKFHVFPNLTFESVLHEIEKQPIISLETQLSTTGGGEVPTTKSAEGEVPTLASYKVRMFLDNNPDLSLKPGMTGIGKIHVDPQTLGYRLWRFINETFNFKL